MTPESAISIIGQAFMAAFWLAAPLLLLGFAVGIAVNLIQVATSLQDAAFSTFPRLAAFLVGVIVMMPWMLKKLTAYTIGVFSAISTYAR